MRIGRNLRKLLPHISYFISASVFIILAWGYIRGIFRQERVPEDAEDSTDKIEGFTTYNDCLARGFTKDFCVQTPVSALGPGGCLCDDGSIGYTIPGFRGECVCDGLYNRVNVIMRGQ